MRSTTTGLVHANSIAGGDFRSRNWPSKTARNELSSEGQRAHITATIVVPTYTTPDVLQTLLSSSLGTADAATTALGVTV